MGEADWTGRRIHFVGIGGAGMSGLARIALELGATVSGSDKTASGVVEELIAAGATAHVGHSEHNVPRDADVVRTSAVGDDNPEVAIALEREQTLLHRSQLLAELTRLKKTIAVTGTHGKTTTSAMVLRALRGAGIDAGWVIGAELQDSEASAGWGSSDWLVVEADESDRSLLVLESEVGVVTNLELDHHATYSSFEDLEKTVSKFGLDARNLVLSTGIGLDSLRDIPGVLVATAGNPDVVGGRAAFDWKGKRVELCVPGLHNALNAAAALEAASLASDDADALIDGIEQFRGTSRRFELKGKMACGAEVYDDYAHHPTEVAATIAAARTMDAGRVIAAFQPHLFSRTKELASDFAEALSTADLAFVSDIYPARELQTDFPGVTANSIANRFPDRIRSAGPLASLTGALEDSALAGDIVLLMGAGDIGSIATGLTDD